MPGFSLIIATCGRTAELHRLFASLEANRNSDFECIVVDQNADGRLLPVLDAWAAKIPIKHLRSAPGLSRARNIGLLYATGEIIAFPDDDCWYSSNLLDDVAEFFRKNTSFRILSVGVRDATGALSGNRWLQHSCDLSTTNLFRTSVGFAFFVRRGPASNALFFDESLGVGSGTPFGSGEDTDYVFRLLHAKERGRFDRRLTIYHERRDMLSGQTDKKRAYLYGCGMGRVIRKRAKLPLLPAFVGFDVLRAVYSLVRGKARNACLCAAHGYGILAGYLASN